LLCLPIWLLLCDAVAKINDLLSSSDPPNLLIQILFHAENKNFHAFFVERLGLIKVIDEKSGFQGFPIRSLVEKPLGASISIYIILHHQMVAILFADLFINRQQVAALEIAVKTYLLFL
jgi:hypothetical protein